MIRDFDWLTNFQNAILVLVDRVRGPAVFGFPRVVHDVVELFSAHDVAGQLVGTPPCVVYMIEIGAEALRMKL